MDVIQTIREKYGGMTRKQKDIADLMLADPERMSFITLKELSAAAHVSEMTVLNACSYLGYANFNELKYEFRKYLLGTRRIQVAQNGIDQQPLIPQRELQSREQILLQVCQEEMSMVSSYLSSVDPADFFKAAHLILEKRSVVLCGRGAARSLADFLSLRLTLLGIPAIFVNIELNDAIQSALPLIGPDALVLVFSFPDYYFMSRIMAQYGHQQGAAVLGVTDSPRAEIVPFCDQVLYCPSSTRMFLNTVSAAMMLITFLASAISIELSSAGRDLRAPARDFAALFDSKAPDSKS